MRIATGWRERLYLPAYTVAEVAKYANVSAQTVARWGRPISDSGPAIAERGSREGLSFLHLVELVVVAAFRQAGVKMLHIRSARNYLQSRFGFEFPFATVRLMTDGAHVLAESAELDFGREVNRILRASESGQIVFSELIRERLLTFEYDDKLVVTWYPLGRNYPVQVDPRIRFGQPAVRGVPTWLIREQVEAGESISDLMEDYGLTPAEIEAALKFEKVPVPVN